MGYLNEQQWRDRAMPYYSEAERIPTLLGALNNYRVDPLKALAQLVSDGGIP